MKIINSVANFLFTLLTLFGIFGFVKIADYLDWQTAEVIVIELMYYGFVLLIGSIGLITQLLFYNIKSLKK